MNVKGVITGFMSISLISMFGYVLYLSTNAETVNKEAIITNSESTPKYNPQTIYKINECKSFSSRSGQKILAIVDHITDGGREGTINDFCNPKLEKSSHYLVCKNGDIIQFVKEADKSWHAGIKDSLIEKGCPNSTSELVKEMKINPNLYSIGIEHEAKQGEGLTDEQYKSTLKLHKELCQKYNIKIDRKYIIGHNEIDNKDRINDPGNTFPWTKLMKDLKGSK